MHSVYQWHLYGCGRSTNNRENKDCVHKYVGTYFHTWNWEEAITIIASQI